MKLAVIDNDGVVVISWPTPDAAHTDIADHVAADVYPHRRRRQARLAAAIRARLLDLQAQTGRL